MSEAATICEVHMSHSWMTLSSPMSVPSHETTVRPKNMLVKHRSRVKHLRERIYDHLEGDLSIGMSQYFVSLNNIHRYLITCLCLSSDDLSIKIHEKLNLLGNTSKMCCLATAHGVSFSIMTRFVKILNMQTQTLHRLCWCHIYWDL